MDPRRALVDFYSAALQYFNEINAATIGRAWGLFAEHSGLVSSILALFLILYFMWGALGRSHISVQDMAVTGFKVALAYAFVMSWALFHENVGKLLLETPEQLGAALSARMGGISGGTNMADQVGLVAQKVYDFTMELFAAHESAAWPNIVGSLIVFMVLGFGLIPMLLVLTGVTLFAKMIVAVMLAIGPIAILCYFFPISNFVFGAWVKGIAYGMFALLFTYVMAGFAFGFIQTFIDKINTGMAVEESALGIAMAMIAYMLLVTFFIFKVPDFAQTFAYGTVMSNVLPGDGGRSAAVSGATKVAAVATGGKAAVVAGAAGAASAGRAAMAAGRGGATMGRMLANRMRGRAG
ncbi:type IV secretion system protein [Aminobacter sp. MET-1]|uniref:type IV secretion system protein n=1 Tax=Aminobacter sp. MET-1 TaxID=2951085 RepID=UPI00226AAF27|nr:type IV secretion system protein [Aminobacter sp. MET-1]MCX8571132.1 type IV secretion system protein [Aminobacter sp. MET-1]MCX8573199.1 type IV secretion system protein [Aminobacter sp. MET-1]